VSDDWHFSGSTRRDLEAALTGLPQRRSAKQDVLARVLGWLLAEIDLEGFDAIIEREIPGGVLPASEAGAEKYLEIAKWLGARLIQALELRLHEEQELRILDLGTGFGYFPAIARALGHRIAALDLPDPLYTEVTGLLGVPVRHHRVEYDVPLPDFGTRFDLVTGFMVTFNMLPGFELWDAAQWKQFIGRVFDEQVADDGALYLVMNDQTRVPGLHHYDPGFEQMLSELGRPFTKRAEKVVIGNLTRCMAGSAS